VLLPLAEGADAVSDAERAWLGDGDARPTASRPTLPLDLDLEHPPEPPVSRFDRLR
jgi:hypothetical protein